MKELPAIAYVVHGALDDEPRSATAIAKRASVGKGVAIRWLPRLSLYGMASQDYLAGKWVRGTGVRPKFLPREVTLPLKAEKSEIAYREIRRRLLVNRNHAAAMEVLHWLYRQGWDDRGEA